MTRIWKWSLTASIVLHLSLAGVGLFYVIGLDRSPSSPGPKAPAASAPADDLAKPVEPQAHEVGRLLAQKDAAYAGLSPARKMAELQHQAGRLEAISPRSVESIARLAERAKGVDDTRAYAPRSGVTGPFDTESATLYDIQPVAGPDGKPAYRHTLVDRDGRTLQYDMPEAQVSDADRMAAKVFQLGRQNPSLRRLIDSAIRIGEAQLTAQSHPASAPTR